MVHEKRKQTGSILFKETFLFRKTVEHIVFGMLKGFKRLRRCLQARDMLATSGAKLAGTNLPGKFVPRDIFPCARETDCLTIDLTSICRLSTLCSLVLKVFETVLIR